jgi:hypothetical protein
MRVEVAAKDLPKHEGKDIYLYDEESKREQKIEAIRIQSGWARGWNRNGKCHVDILLSYNLTKIFIEA